MELSQAVKVFLFFLIHLNLFSLQVVRITIDFDVETNSYNINNITKELSGTSNLEKSVLNPKMLGSHVARLVDPSSNEILQEQSVGIGYFYRYLFGGMSFRFLPHPEPLKFILFAENNTSGKMEEVFNQEVDLSKAEDLKPLDVELSLIREALVSNPIIVTIYSEGFTEDRKEIFWQKAEKLVENFQGFPGEENFEIYGAFYASEQAWPSESGLSIPRLNIPISARKDSFLGLYYPHWSDEFGRWYNIVYPTDEDYLRRGLGQVMYDYPIILIDSDGYFGMGNYNAITAIGSNLGYSKYLLQHEFGHFLGLNEEYESAGDLTELRHGPEATDCCDPNIAFSIEEAIKKWGMDITLGSDVEIPTPKKYDEPGVVGIFRGGYGDSNIECYKPAHSSCTMSYPDQSWCHVCSRWIKHKIDADRGILTEGEFYHRSN